MVFVTYASRKWVELAGQAPLDSRTWSIFSLRALPLGGNQTTLISRVNSLDNYLGILYHMKLFKKLSTPNNIYLSSMLLY